MKRWIYTALAIELIAVTAFAVLYDSLDFRIYMLGGQALTNGAHLYLDQQSAHWFTNTPFAATLFLPLSELPLTLARVLWQLGSVAALAYSCNTTLKLMGRGPSRPQTVAVTATFLALEPMWHSISLGQINLYLLALVLADIHRISQNRHAGIFIGLAAAIKLTPAIFIVLLLVTKRTRPALTSSATFALATLLAFAISPAASKVYWRDTFYDTSRVGVTYISNQSPYGTLARVLHSPSHIGPWYPLIPLTLATIGLLIAATYARRNNWLTTTAVTGTTGLLVSPISWSHHWVWILPALAVLVRNNHHKPAACVYTLFALAPQWWTPHNGHPLEYGLNIFTPIANCYLIAGITFLTYAAATLHLNPATEQPSSQHHTNNQQPQAAHR